MNFKVRTENQKEKQSFSLRRFFHSSCSQIKIRGEKKMSKSAERMLKDNGYGQSVIISDNPILHGRAVLDVCSHKHYVTVKQSWIVSVIQSIIATNYIINRRAGI